MMMLSIWSLAGQPDASPDSSPAQNSFTPEGGWIASISSKVFGAVPVKTFLLYQIRPFTWDFTISSYCFPLTTPMYNAVEDEVSAVSVLDRYAILLSS